MRPYVTVQSFGICFILSCESTKTVFVPFSPVNASPWANPPNSFPNACVQMSEVAGSLASFLWEVTVSPVVGWMTGAAKCSKSGAGG